MLWTSQILKWIWYHMKRQRKMLKWFKDLYSKANYESYTKVSHTSLLVNLCVDARHLGWAQFYKTASLKNIIWLFNF